MTQHKLFRLSAALELELYRRINRLPATPSSNLPNYAAISRSLTFMAFMEISFKDEDSTLCTVSMHDKLGYPYKMARYNTVIAHAPHAAKTYPDIGSFDAVQDHCDIDLKGCMNGIGINVGSPSDPIYADWFATCPWAPAA
jgi:hypothetical protein